LEKAFYKEDLIMNLVVLMGRLTKDPNVTYTKGAEPMCIARYTLAVDRRGKKQEGQPTADFISCVAFKSNAEFAEKYLKQGTKVVVEGHIQTGSYTDKNGNKVYTTDVIIDSQEFAESKKDTQEAAPSAPADKDGFMSTDGVDMDELPFS
jgi:single-strand DNA-binding protein